MVAGSDSHFAATVGPGPHGHKPPRAGHKEAARIHRRKSAGGQAKGGPAWMPDKIGKPMVKKVGTETLEEL